MNKTKFNSSIYVVCWGKDYPLKATPDNDGKGIHALSWRTTDIKAGEYNGNTHLIFTEYSDAQKYFNDYTPSGYFVFMMTDSELYRAPTSHKFAEDQYPERATDSVQSYINVYQGTVSSSFPYV